MARTISSERTAKLRDHARRGLSPELAAHEMGVSFECYKKWLTEAGGQIGRVVRMPDEREIHDARPRVTSSA